MWIYIMLCLLPALPVLKTRTNLRQNDKIRSITLFFLILLLMLSCRSISVGMDTAMYKAQFEHFAALPFNATLEYKEPAFSLLCKIVSLFTTDYQFFLMVCSVIIIVPIIVLYRRQIEYPVLTALLFITLPTFSMLFSGIRQCIAISCGIIAFAFVKRKRLILFLLTVLMAMQFHRSSFILFLMYPVYHNKFKKRSLLYIVPIYILVFVFNEQIFAFLRLFLTDYADVTDVYTGQVTMLILFVMFSAFCFFIVNEQEIDQDMNGMRNFLLLTTFIQFFAPLNTLAMRIGYYYLIFLPITIPKVIANSRKDLQQIATLAHIIMVLFFSVRFFLVLPTNNSLNIYPYFFFWETR